jgi:peptidoglycan/LPS O-acetylase OafA/YrhL
MASAPQSYVPWLDGWRGLSILAVLVGHFLPIPGINAGRLGVEMFFCLSGRLMADILFVRRVALVPFVLRRMTRVWPALWVFVLVCALAFRAGVYEVEPVHLLGALTFTQNYVTIAGSGNAIFDHLWSLGVEEWTYVLLVVLALLVRRSTSTPVPALLAGAFMASGLGIWLTLSGGDYYEVYWRTDVRLASILLPCAAFLILRDRRVPSGWLPIAAACFGLALNSSHVPDLVKYTAGTTMLAVSVATLGSAPSFVRSALSSPPLRYIGLWSFSLYLWQQPLTKLDFANPPVRLAIVFALALMSYYLVEQPARKLLNRKIAGLRPDPVPRPAAAD